MAKQQQEPVFVNLQSGNVRVYDENRRRISVAPWSKRNRGQDGLFEVIGEHYRQFVSPQGPLFPRPAGAESAAPAPSASAAASEKKVSGDQTPGADAGGEETKEPNPPEVPEGLENPEVPEESDEPDPPEDPEDLSDFTVDGAAEWIAATEDVVLLKEWAEVDHRKGIKEAVEKRLAELAEQGPPS